MSHAALLKIERFRDDDDSEFRVRSQREMLHTLKAIADHGERVALYRDGDPDPLLTTLVDTNTEGLWLDVYPHTPENQRFLLVEKITFVSMHQNVKIQFTVDSIETAILDGEPVFFMRLPSYLLRIQRRGHFRLRLPGSNPVKCTIPVASSKPDKKPTLHTARALDISDNGIGLLCRENETEIVPGKTFRDCQIALPGDGIITVSLDVRNNVPLTSHIDSDKHRVGCQFMHMDKQTNMLLHRYLKQLARKSAVMR